MWPCVGRGWLPTWLSGSVSTAGQRVTLSALRTSPSVQIPTARASVAAAVPLQLLTVAHSPRRGVNGNWQVREAISARREEWPGLALPARVSDDRARGSAEATWSSGPAFPAFDSLGFGDQTANQCADYSAHNKGHPGNRGVMVIFQVMSVAPSRSLRIVSPV